MQMHQVHSIGGGAPTINLVVYNLVVAADCAPHCAGRGRSVIPCTVANVGLCVGELDKTLANIGDV